MVAVLLMFAGVGLFGTFSGFLRIPVHREHSFRFNAVTCRYRVGTHRFAWQELRPAAGPLKTRMTWSASKASSSRKPRSRRLSDTARSQILLLAPS